MATFRDRLEEGMKRIGMTPAELSRRTGIGEGAISQYRHGAYKATQSNLEKISQALSVSVSWLMGCDAAPDVSFTDSENYTDAQRALIEIAKNLTDNEAAALLAAARSLEAGRKDQGADKSTQ